MSGILYRSNPITVRKLQPHDQNLLSKWLNDPEVLQYYGGRAFWNRGIGQHLMDPQAWNERAIACYEKCGFRKVKLLPQHEWHEGE